MTDEKFKRIGIYTVNDKMRVIKRLKQEAIDKGYQPEVILFNDIHIAVRSPKKFRIFHKNEAYIPPRVIINRLPATAPGLSLLILSQFERTRRSKIINRAFRSAVARDKFRTMQVLASKGFIIPNTVLLGSNKERDLKWAVKGVGGFPAILKLTRGSLGMGVVKVDNFSTLRSVLDLVNRKRRSMILQQFISNEPGVDYRFYVVGNKVVAAMRRATKNKNEFRANISLGGQGVKYRPTPQEEKLLEILIRKSSIQFPSNWKDDLLVRPMKDDGMGSLYLFPRGEINTNRKLGKQVSELRFVDKDGTEAIASLNVDDQEKLFELDIWKTDFSKLIKIPDTF